MKRKMIISVALATVLASGLYASCYNNMSGGNNMCGGNGNYNNAPHKMMKKGSSGFMSMVYQLNLNEKQKEQISAIRQEMFKNRFQKESAFTESSFDKDKYIELMKQRRENMIESKAEMIDKVYKLLDKEQKKELKAMMDRKERISFMMNKRMNFDQNCYGRR